jgi:hypothetical protein
MRRAGGGSPPAEGADKLRKELEDARAAAERLEQERDRLALALAWLCDSVGRADVAQVVRDVTGMALSLTEADVSTFVPGDQGDSSLPAVSLPQSGPGATAAGGFSGDVPHLEKVLWRGEPVEVEDHDGSLRSWLGVPVKTRYGDTLGALFVAHAQSRAFGTRDLELVKALAAYLGARFETLALFLERAHVAGALQRTLLPPPLPEIPGLEVAARYRPAKTVARVGGDFYDVFEVEEGTWGVLVGDVSGVGPEAAALTGVARYGARAVATGEHSPTELLHQLNDMLFRLRLREKFCTVLYAHLRPEGGAVKVKLANGGHPCPWLLRRDGKTEQVEVYGMLLGAFEQISLEQGEVVLAPGDLMVFYTDGVVEARAPDGAFFGTQGLRRVLSSSQGASADAVARAIELAVLDHQSASTRDDIAVLVVRKPETGERA